MTDDFIEDFKTAIDYCRQHNIKIVSVQQALEFYGIVNKNKLNEKK